MNEKLVVWIIDDDVVSKYVMKRNLKELNTLNVLEFPNSEEPLKILNALHEHSQALPDLIFLDVNMPIIDGFQFLEEYNTIKHSVNKNIHIYMLSSSLNPEDRVRAKSFSTVLDYHVKPINLDLIQKMIETVTLN
ncbi:MAG: response regulator [Maribacter sp.]